MYEDPNYELTPEEKKMIQDAEGLQGFGSSVGGTIGTLGGTALSFIPGAQPFAPLIIPAAGALGTWIGGSLGGMAAKDAAERFERERRRRLGPLEDEARRAARTSQLLSAWTTTPGL
jgi:hypothetical protein